MSLEYTDFVLRLRRGRSQYIASLLFSPAGEVLEQPIDLDIRSEHYTRQLQGIEEAIRRLRNVTRGAISPERRLLEGFGDYLFSAVFCHEVRSRYDTCVAMARQEGKGLRIKLRLEAPELTAVPWEVAYDEREKHFLTLSAYSPIVRYVELKREIPTLAASFPLQVLVLAPEARNYPGLEIHKERARLEAAVQDLVGASLVEIDFLDGSLTLSRLQEALRRKSYHVVHYIGHGGYNRTAEQGALIFTDDNGSGEHVSGDRLGILLRDAPTVRLVLLNACEGGRGSPRVSFTSVASALVLVGVPAVVAMQFRITDRAAIRFASAFYLSLVDNYPVDASVAEARKAIALQSNYDTVEWVTPVLYMRAPNGVIFELPPSELASHKREQVLSNEEEQLADLFRQGMRYLDSEQFPQALIVFEQIRSINPTYRKINIREIIAYVRAEIVKRQRDTVARSSAGATQRVYGEQLKGVWRSAKQSMESLVQNLRRREGETIVVSDTVDWDWAIEKAITAVRKRLGQRVWVCSWAVVQGSEQINLILGGKGQSRFRALVDGEGEVLELTPEKQPGLEWMDLLGSQVAAPNRARFQCEGCGRHIEVTLDEQNQAKVKCKDCGAYYCVLSGDTCARIDVRCPFCGFVNLARINSADRKVILPSNCKRCGWNLATKLQ